MAALTSRQSYAVTGIVLGLGFLLVLVCSNLCSTSPDAPERDSSLNLTSEQTALLNDLQSQGILSIEPQLNRAFVDLALWVAMDARQKEDFSAAVSIYCANRKGTTTYWAEIYDKQSAKKLAKWSRVYGFEVF